MGPQGVTVAIIRGMCGGDRIGRLCSKAQKLTSVKDEERLRPSPTQTNAIQYGLSQTPHEETLR
jgi:hypothetical protein